MGKSAAFLVAFLAATLPSVLAATAPEQQIHEVLNAQVAAWNRGDIPAFMEGYDKSESTTFVSTNITKGHEQVLKSYLKRYPTRDNMGTLEFKVLDIRMLGSDYAAVIGKFHLSRSPGSGGETGGIFTLLFRNTQKGWKIILDHTS